MNNGLTNLNVTSLVVSDTDIFAGTFNGGIFLSTDGGTNWTQVNNGLTNLRITCFAISGTNIFAGTWGGVYLSTNNGAKWIRVNNGLPYVKVNSFAVSDTNLFAGTTRGVFLSTNNGTNWTSVNDGLTDTTVNAIAVSGTHIFAGTENNGVFKASISSLFNYTGIEQPKDTRAPLSFTLSQNYPNPFNPSTTINYQVPSSGKVVLKVYDILGREVEALVNENKSAGKYSVSFNADKLASGVYLYRIQEGSYFQTKKMILIK